MSGYPDQRKQLRMLQQFAACALLIFGGGLITSAGADEAEHISASFSSTQPVSPNSSIQLHSSKPIAKSQERLAVMIGDTDVTSLCVTTNTDITYNAKPFPLPLGETSVIVYLITSQNEWSEIARLPLLVAQPKDEQVKTASATSQPPNAISQVPQENHVSGPFQFIPSISVNVKSQSTALFFPDSSRPDRINFTDVAVQASLQGNYQNRVVSIQNQFDLAGTSVQNEALRFGQLGANAPQLDLSGYSMKYQFRKSTLRLGNVSFGSNRELINSFSSRGISLTVPLSKRFDISGAMMNGTSVVGFANFFGISKRKHQVSSATLGIELVEKRPGGFRIELTGLKGSLLPLNSFNQGAVSDAERSKGGSIRVVASDKAQHFHFDGGFARSQFTNPRDPLLYQGLAVIPVRAVWRNARYLEVAYDLLNGYKLTEKRPLILNLSYRHERVDPLYRSVAAFAQADHLNNQLDLTGSLTPITFALNYTRANDNLNGIKSILQTLSRRYAFSIAAPATALLNQDSNSRWNPHLSFNFDRIHQFAAFVPINGDFVSSTQIPDQVSLLQNFSAEWQLSSNVRAGYRFNYSFQDNRQNGRQRSDLLNENNGVTFGLSLKNLDLNFDLAAERASSFDQNSINSTFRIGTSLTWRMTSKMAWALNASTTGAGDRAKTNHRRDADFDIQYTWRFLTTEKNRWRKVQGQFFVRYANRYGLSNDFVFGFQNFNKLQTFNAGLNFIFF
jgi:hypothetical protein